MHGRAALMRNLRGVWIEVSLAAVLTAGGLLITVQPDDGNGETAVDTLVIPAVTLPVLWFRRAPLGAAFAISAGMVISGIPTFNQTRCGVAIPAALLILFSLASRRERGPALAGLAAVEAGIVFLLFTDPQLDVGAVFFLPLGAAVWGAGRIARSRATTAAELASRTRDLERTREETARLVVDVERARLATEIDVEARDRLGAVVELAGRGERNVERTPEESRVAFGKIESEGRQSLNEIRDLLGVLRSDDSGTTPRPTLKQLETFLGQARVGGEPVALDIEGEQRPLPDGVELAAYRMIQLVLEAFADVDDGPAGVKLLYGKASLELEVRGSLPAGARPVGLESAQERVSAHGGTFTSAPEGAGGRLLVNARLPVIPAGA